ncbi:hypothetical protein GGI25_004540 [Coemansia spiralis]|uniref:Uncharacterized protein n=2 Tax=Coemansia TaxID=4863 RepID=A0A9W8G417_9FUNG|nr:hypothetical protein GGI26_004788 [Coemansia sp. RSA 1358]KAJ2673973.1 hypothetical protein GGI25_004540 [Coemansia spiralis]
MVDKKNLPKTTDTSHFAKQRENGSYPLPKRRPSFGSEEEPVAEKQRSLKSRQKSKRRNIFHIWGTRSKSSSPADEAQTVPEIGESDGSEKEASSTGGHPILSINQAGSSVDDLHSSSSETGADLPSATAEEIAALKIQRMWRFRAICKPVERWQDVNVTVARLSRMSFEDATKLMQQPDIVQSSAFLLQALLSHTAPISIVLALEDTPCKAPGRAFVAGHLFAAHPSLLVTGNSHLDTMIESSAITMTQAYALFADQFLQLRKVTCLVSNRWYERQQSFVASFRAFSAALDSWKQADSKKLLATMERHYLELDKLWQSVQRRTLGKGDEVWRVGIQEQREGLMSKVKALGGQDAVDSLTQRQQHLRLTYSDPQPSQTPSLPPPLPSSENEMDTGQTFATEAEDLHVTNGVNTLKVDSHQGSVAEENPSSSDGYFPHVANTTSVLAKAVSDPSSAEIDRILGNFDLTVSAALEDAKIAHELVLDPQMRLEPAANNTLAGTVQQTVIRTFFDNARDGIIAGNGEHIVWLFEQLRLEMRSIIPPSGSTRATLERELESEWIATQLENGACDIKEKFKLVLRLIREVCAPIRDETVYSLIERVDILDHSTLSEIYKAVSKSASNTSMSSSAQECVASILYITQDILSLIRNVCLDALNHQIDTVVRPWLQMHATKYEHSKLGQLLESACGDNKQKLLKTTTGWMQDAVARENSHQCSVLQASESATPKHVFWESLLDLCFASRALTAETTPVTLAMDQNRICHMQNDIQVILSTGALCMLIKSAVRKRGGLTTDTAMLRFASDMRALLLDDAVTMDRIVSLVQQTATSATSNRAEKEAGDMSESIERLVRKTLAKDDPVYGTIEKQLRRFLLSELCKDEATGDLAARLNNEALDIAAILKRTALDMESTYICDLLLRINRLGTFNWQVCSPWYAKVSDLL